MSTDVNRANKKTPSNVNDKVAARKQPRKKSGSTERTVVASTYRKRSLTAMNEDEGQVSIAHTRDSALPPPKKLLQSKENQNNQCFININDDDHNAGQELFHEHNDQIELPRGQNNNNNNNTDIDIDNNFNENKESSEWNTIDIQSDSNKMKEALSIIENFDPLLLPNEHVDHSTLNINDIYNYDESKLSIDPELGLIHDDITDEKNMYDYDLANDDLMMISNISSILANNNDSTDNENDKENANANAKTSNMEQLPKDSVAMVDTDANLNSPENTHVSVAKLLDRNDEDDHDQQQEEEEEEEKQILLEQQHETIAEKDRPIATATAAAAAAATTTYRPLDDEFEMSSPHVSEDEKEMEVNVNKEKNEISNEAAIEIEQAMAKKRMEEFQSMSNFWKRVDTITQNINRKVIHNNGDNSNDNNNTNDSKDTNENKTNNIDNNGNNVNNEINYEQCFKKIEVRDFLQNNRRRQPPRHEEDDNDMNNRTSADDTIVPIKGKRTYFLGKKENVWEWNENEDMNMNENVNETVHNVVENQNVNENTDENVNENINENVIVQ